MPSVQFFEEDVSFQLPNEELVSTWIDRIIESEGYSLQELNFIFCSDDYLHKINLDYLKHDTLTDIVTFDNSDEEKEIEGDIFISIDRVKDNAKDQSVSFDEELQRVIIHGVLHLLGYGDKTEEEKKQMREKEEGCLSLLH